MNRTRAQRRWIRKGYTHEVAYWSGHDKSWNFILVTRADVAAHFRRHPLPDDWVRPVSPQFLHNGRKPR